MKGVAWPTLDVVAVGRSIPFVVVSVFPVVIVPVSFLTAISLFLPLFFPLSTPEARLELALLAPFTPIPLAPSLTVSVATPPVFMMTPAGFLAISVVRAVTVHVCGPIVAAFPRVAAVGNSGSILR